LLLRARSDGADDGGRDTGMPSKRTVYAATSGSYSDYAVDALFERREDAERYVAAGLAEDIEEIPLYAEMPQLYTVYTATIGKRGPGRSVGQLRTTSYVTTDEPEHKTGDSDWMVTAEGPDRERVVKSVRDRYARWKAQQEGIS
jgi:hypothetical protein